MQHVSVVIPLYNKAPHVQRCIDSVIGQTFSDWDLVVVDDGSTDGGGEVVRACSDRRVSLIAQTNSGPGAARNAGLLRARGPLVAFLDADDEWEPDYLRCALAEFEQHGPDTACVSMGYTVWPAGRSTEPIWLRKGLRDGLWRATPETPPMLLTAVLEFLVPWNTVSRREILVRHGGFFDRYRCLYAEDAYLWLKVLMNETIAIRLRPLVRFHGDASALSRNLRGPRPVEPFFTDDTGLYESCPLNLHPLLREVLAIRAAATACMLGYWGRWREARRLLHRFASRAACPGAKRNVALMLATPPGAVATAVARRLLPVHLLQDGL